MSEQQKRTYNNSVTLIGNLGAEAEDRVSNSTGITFTVASLYTQKSYKDDNDEFQNLPSVMHDLIAFSPKVMADLRAYRKGARIKVIGEITYEPLQVTLRGKEVKIYQTSIVVKKVEPATLFKKSNLKDRDFEHERAVKAQLEDYVQQNSSAH